jgi:hypothetical protein
MGKPTFQSEDYGLSSREMSWLSIRERFFDFVINRRPLRRTLGPTDVVLDVIHKAASAGSAA